MRFSQIKDCLTCKEYFRGDNYDDAEVQNVTAGDLMSEVLVFDRENVLLVTALNSEQALRTASMVDALAVILVNNKVPSPGMISLAEELGTSMFSTGLSMFEACAELHQLLKKDI